MAFIGFIFTGDHASAAWSGAFAQPSATASAKLKMRAPILMAISFLLAATVVPAEIRSH
jgi:hypothetical protein